jgi:hypothetical protein
VRVVRAPGGSEPGRPGPWLDSVIVRSNHNYMSTEYETDGAPGTADAPGKDKDGKDGRDDEGEGGSMSGRGSGIGEQVRGWFTGRLPGEWFTGPAEVIVDREEISVVGTLPAVEVSETEVERATAAEGRIQRFREETRTQRIEIAREAEHRFRRKVAWGARCGDSSEMFTALSVPVMTRLRQSERRVLDTLVDAGVARSRSDALAWCVRLTGEHADAWLTELRVALRRVEEVRAQGPAAADA